jgi:hypothetical protein
MDTDKEVYFGKSIFSDIHVRGTVGDFREVTIRLKKQGFDFCITLGEAEAQQLGRMISAAADSLRS